MEPTLTQIWMMCQVELDGTGYVCRLCLSFDTIRQMVAHVSCGALSVPFRVMLLLDRYPDASLAPTRLESAHARRVRHD